MSATYKFGFTIIETMLFLAVTGVLVVAILAGTGSSINIQRYHDSVSTLKSGLEQLYADVSSVRNEVRAAAVSCSPNAVIDTSGATLQRGQSDCTVLGRYLTIDKTAITVSTVIGNNPAAAPLYATDIKELQAYKLSLLPTSSETSQLEWGAMIAWPTGGVDVKTPSTPRQVSLLVLRSPTSGLTYTFSSNDVAMPLHDMIIAGDVVPGQGQQRLCIDSDGGFGGGLAVVIGAYASTSSSLQVRSNDMGDSSTC